MKRIGIDLGGTKIEIILTPPDSIEPIFKKRVPTEQEKGYASILRKICDLVAEARSHTEDPVTIGIGIPGSVSPRTGKVRNANSQCLNGNSLKKDLEEKLEAPVFVANDANCLALSESTYGAGKGIDSVLAVILGTGMGGGIVTNGKLLEGLHGNAGEWGHYSLNMNGEKCWCGNQGCMELYLSGTGFQRLYAKRSGGGKNVEEIYADFLAGDSVAKETVEDYLRYFGRGFADMIYIFDPDAIVLGGGVSNLPFLYDQGVEKVRENLFDKSLEFRILKNEMGDSSGIYGALLLPSIAAD